VYNVNWVVPPAWYIPQKWWGHVPFSSYAGAALELNTDDIWQLDGREGGFCKLQLTTDCD